MRFIIDMHSIETEAELIRFASMDCTAQRYEWLQSYYSNLFDLWENPPIDCSEDTLNRVRDARWLVYDYAESRGWHLDRDSLWCVSCLSSDGSVWTGTEQDHGHHGMLTR